MPKTSEVYLQKKSSDLGKEAGAVSFMRGGELLPLDWQG